MNPPTHVVLLIEDEQDIAEVLQTALEFEGFTVYWAKDGQEALKLAQEIKPSVIISDMMMPVMDGFGFLKEYLKATESTGHRAPVLAISAMQNYLEHALQSGAVAAMGKPLDLDSFITAVQKLCEGQIPKVEAPSPAREEVERLERQRMDAILSLKLDQPAPEEALHEFVDYVARLFGVPICLLSMVTEKEQYWTAMCDLNRDLRGATRSERSESFCTHAVVAQAALVVQDALENPFFRGNRWVREKGLRFYAGVPLILHGGEAVGTLCLLDFKARSFSHLDLELLSALARRVLAELEWREKKQHGEAEEAELKFLQYVDPELGVVRREGFLDVLKIEALRQAERGARVTVALVEVEPSRMREAYEAANRAFPLAWKGRLGPGRLGLVLSAVEPARARRELMERIPRLRGLVTDEASRRVGGMNARLLGLESRLEQELLQARGWRAASGAS